MRDGIVYLEMKGKRHSFNVSSLQRLCPGFVLIGNNVVKGVIDDK